MSATLQERRFETPNAATWLAQNLVSRGEFAFSGLRALQLPGESLYLAAAFKTFPEKVWPYIHVPVVVLFVTAIAAFALAVGGSGLALATGIVASLDPYIVWHGPIWDDTLLAAALEWSLFSLVITFVASPQHGMNVARSLLPLVICLAAFAALTRTLSQLVLIAVGLLAIGHPRFRPARATGVAIVLGVLIGMGAWGLRNCTVLGQFHLGSSHDGEVLFKSNCAYTREGIREQGVVGTIMHDCSADQAAHAQTLGELEYDRQLRQHALAYMAANPSDVAKTGFFKLAVTLTGFNFAAPVFAMRNVVAVCASLFSLSIGIFGVSWLWRSMASSAVHSAAVWMCVVVGVLTLLMLAIGPTGLRYRISFNGFLYLGVAAVLIEKLPFAWTRTRLFPTRLVSAVRH